MKIPSIASIHHLRLKIAARLNELGASDKPADVALLTAIGGYFRIAKTSYKTVKRAATMAGESRVEIRFDSPQRTRTPDTVRLRYQDRRGGTSHVIEFPMEILFSKAAAKEFIQCVTEDAKQAMLASATHDYRRFKELSKLFAKPKGIYAELVAAESSAAVSNG